MNWIVTSSLVLVVLVSLFLMDTSITGYFVLSPEQNEVLLGYCPTMKEDAQSLSNEKGYTLVELSSAQEVLARLKRGAIDKALIGRKAKLNELGPGINEVIIKSGYTLVSNERRSVDKSYLPLLKVYTYVSAPMRDILPLIEYVSPEEVLEKRLNNEIVLIPWEDWEDHFELVVVYDGKNKMDEFRGTFLYE